MSVEEIQNRLTKLKLSESQMASGTNPVSQIITVEAFMRMQKQLEQLQKIKTPLKAEPRVHIEKDPPPSTSTSLKPTELPEIYGDLEHYPSWRAAVLDIFRMDWNLFGYDNLRAFLMIYKSLKGSALKKAGPFYENGGVHGTRNPEDFIEFLDRINLDPTRVSRANDELHGMKMKDNQKWPDFIAAWSNKLTEARGDFWADENKISMLKSSINRKLAQTLAGNHLLSG